MHNQRKPTHVKHLKCMHRKANIRLIFVFICRLFLSFRCPKNVCRRYHGPFWSTSTKPYLNAFSSSHPAFNIHSTFIYRPVAFSLVSNARCYCYFFEPFYYINIGYLVPKIIGFSFLFLPCLCCYYYYDCNSK